MKSCTWNGIEYPSVKAAADDQGVCYDTMYKRFKNGYEDDSDLSYHSANTPDHVPDIRNTHPVNVESVAGNPDKYPVLLSSDGYRVLNIVQRELYRRGTVYGVRLATRRSTRAEAMLPGNHLRHITPLARRAACTILFAVRLTDKRYVILSHEDPRYRHIITGYAPEIRVRRYLQANTSATYTGELA